MKIDWKKLVPDALIMLLFVLAAVIYCSPALDDKIIYAGDYINGYSAAHEGAEYRDQGGSTWWTGSMFSGMPNYQIGGGARYKSDTILMPFIRFFRWGTRNAIFILLFYLVAFYLLMRTFKIERWISLAGAFATSFSSYFFIIIAAQHHGKTVAITWMMLVLIGFVLIYRRQYLWGALLVMFFIPMGFFVHPQMSYYICMLIGVLFFAELYKAIRDSEWKHFGLATCTFALAFAVGMGIGSANIFANQEYAEQTMRGGHSDLVSAQQTDKAAAATAKGLDLEYATAWSEGIGETFTMMIPNLMGGMSGYALDEDSEFCKTLVQAGYTKSQAKEYGRHAPTYWGDKMFTSGPVYIGAIVCFLFLLGLLLVDGPYK
ncbi:MAG: hypothetical protein IJ680_07855, partial [Paludibacteraceae bacterium]|nr:hypothetical protein [Paludibacteraceae bacterium]